MRGDGQGGGCACNGACVRACGSQVKFVATPLEEARHPEEAQRLLGNDKFAAGDLEGAIRCYSICLGLKKGNVAAFANRAACYLKHRSV